jgi:hypothetical protein
MKTAIRIAILMVGILGTFLAASVQPVPAVADGGPIIVCPGVPPTQPAPPNCGVKKAS